jgi:hypothetical protein
VEKADDRLRRYRPQTEGEGGMTTESLIEKIQAKWELVNRNRQLRSLGGDYTGQDFMNGECSAFQEAIGIIRWHFADQSQDVTFTVHCPNPGRKCEQLLKREDFMRFVIHVNRELGDFTKINQYAADRLYEMLEAFLGSAEVGVGLAVG